MDFFWQAIAKPADGEYIAKQLAAVNTLMAEDAAESGDRKGPHKFFRGTVF